MSKQTAVEWLENCFASHWNYDEHAKWDGLIHQAKQMEIDNLKTESNNANVLLPAVLFEKLIEMICDNSGGTWTKGCSEVLVVDEVDVHGLADDIVRYLSENGR
jgi:hypothetical protein